MLLNFSSTEPVSVTPEAAAAVVTTVVEEFWVAAGSVLSVRESLRVLRCRYGS